MAPVEVALGAHRILNVQMAEQIRLITIKRGHDPRRFTLMAFGGAGPLHAGAMISMLGMKGCLIPQTPGVLSAFGLLNVNVEMERQASFLRRADEADHRDLVRVMKDVGERCIAIMRDDGFNVDQVRVRHSADLRYIGQSYEITVPIREERDGAKTIDRLISDFEEQYTRLYGVSNKSEVEIVNVRVVAYNPVETLDHLRLHPTGIGEDALLRESEVWFLGSERPLSTKIYGRDRLRPGVTIGGPAVVEQTDTTVLIYPGQTALVDDHHNLFISGISEAYTK